MIFTSVLEYIHTRPKYTLTNCFTFEHKSQKCLSQFDFFSKNDFRVEFQIDGIKKNYIG